VANSGLTPGDEFTVSAYGVSLTVTIDADDTLQTLAEKIQAASNFQATAKVVTSGGVQQLQIAPVNQTATVTLGSGPNGEDALPALGLTPGILTTATTSTSKTNTLLASYGLNLPGNLNLSSTANIAAAQAALSSATGTVARIYTNMTTPPAAKKTGATNTSANGAVPAYLTAEIASYQSALARLTAGSGTTATSIASLF
jgi:hypothetical protein